MWDLCMQTPQTTLLCCFVYIKDLKVQPQKHFQIKATTAQTKVIERGKKKKKNLKPHHWKELVKQT